MISSVSPYPLAGNWDVIVCGGGPAGIAATTAAARRGVRTLLVEALSYLGGMASAGLVNGWCDTQSGPLAQELEERLTQLGVAIRHYNPKAHLCKSGRMRFNGDMMAAVALRMLHEAGAEVRFGALAVEAWRSESGTLKGVVLASKRGLAAAEGSVVVDTSADGDVATSAGAEFMLGDPEDGRLQHVNFRYRLGGVNRAEANRERPPLETLRGIIACAHQEGRLRPPTGVRRPAAEAFPLDLVSGSLHLEGWEIEDVNPADPVEVSRCLMECQLAALDIVVFCRAHLPGYEECRIERLPGLLGTRESRRILGEYVLTHDDVVTGRKFDDGVARCCFFVDLHDSPPGLSIPFTMEYKRATMPPPDDWYEIPYRCLLPKGLPGMLTAGRCISCDRSGQGSMRLQPTCMYTGEAAGIAAALAIRDCVTPHNVDGQRVRREIGM